MLSYYAYLVHMHRTRTQPEHILQLISACGFSGDK